MLVNKREYFEEVHAILQEGVDFTKEDLEGNVLVGDRLKELTSKARNEIATRNGYQQMYWAGHYNPDTETIECTFKNPVYIDEYACINKINQNKRG